MKRKVAIVTDSTAYLPQELLDSLGISVVTLSVNWDGKTYRDGIDIKPDEFYARLAKSDTLPTTSQSTVHDYSEVYKKLLAIVIVIYVWTHAAKTGAQR